MSGRDLWLSLSGWWLKIEEGKAGDEEKDETELFRGKSISAKKQGRDEERRRRRRDRASNYDRCLVRRFVSKIFLKDLQFQLDKIPLSKFSLIRISVRLNFGIQAPGRQSRNRRTAARLEPPGCRWDSS